MPGGAGRGGGRGGGAGGPLGGFVEGLGEGGGWGALAVGGVAALAALAAARGRAEPAIAVAVREVRRGGSFLRADPSRPPPPPPPPMPLPDTPAP